MLLLFKVFREPSGNRTPIEPCGSGVHILKLEKFSYAVAIALAASQPNVLASFRTFYCVCYPCSLWSVTCGVRSTDSASFFSFNAICYGAVRLLTYAATLSELFLYITSCTPTSPYGAISRAINHSRYDAVMGQSSHLLFVLWVGTYPIVSGSTCMLHSGRSRTPIVGRLSAGVSIISPCGGKCFCPSTTLSILSVCQ